jgi:23S rRNA pseudouridine2605 synthase
MERLNKFLAHAGVGSRRHCDDLIAAGRVKIDGQRVSDLGVRVDPERQKVTVDDTPVRPEKPVYWVVHKPPGYLCTNHDPAGRPKALDLLPSSVDQRVYTVGRLDEGSEGLLLMTNDGELAFALMHPRYGVDKTYMALVAGKPTPDDYRKLLEGVWLSDGKAKAKSAKRVRGQGNGTWVRIVLNEGKNREIRRILAKLGHKVLRLQRIAIGPVQLDKLPKGKARKLSLPEVQELKKEAEAGRTRIEQKLKTARGEVSAAPPRDEPPRLAARRSRARPNGDRRSASPRD